MITCDCDDGGGVAFPDELIELANSLATIGFGWSPDDGEKAPVVWPRWAKPEDACTAGTPGEPPSPPEK